MIIEITILTAPIAVSVEQAAPIMAEIGGIGTLTVNNYYSEGGAGGYILTDADKEAIATLARYDDTEIRNLIAQIQGYDDTAIRALIAALAAYDDTEIRALIDQRAQELGDYIGQSLSAFAQDMSQIDQRSRQNKTAIEGINTSISQFAEVGQTVTQQGQAIGEINANLGDIATILDAINGEAI